MWMRKVKRESLADGVERIIYHTTDRIVSNVVHDMN